MATRPRAIGRDLPSVHITFDYKTHGARIAALEKHIGSAGWLELSKLTVESFETEEFLVFAAKTDGSKLLDGGMCRKLMSLPGMVATMEPGMATDLLHTGEFGAS